MISVKGNAMSLVNIHSPEKAAKFRAGEIGNNIFSVKNTSGKSKRLGIVSMCDDEKIKPWLNVGSSEIELDDNTLTEIKISINVDPNAEPGRYNYKISVFDAEDTPNSVQSEPVYFEVKSKEEKAIPWKWIIPAIVGVLLFVSLIVYIAIPKSDELPVLKDMALTKAESELKAKNIDYTVKYQNFGSGAVTVLEHNSNLPLTVSASNPEGKIKEGESVELTAIVKYMPDFSSTHIEDAKTLMNNLGIKHIVKLKALPNNQIKSILDKKETIIVDQTPKANELLSPGTQVTIWTAGVNIPNVVNNPATTGINKILATPGLLLSGVKPMRVSNLNQNGKIIKTIPVTNTLVELGTSVEVIVGQGKTNVFPFLSGDIKLFNMQQKSNAQSLQYINPKASAKMLVIPDAK